MDALSDVLRRTRLRGGVFLHAEFTEPWCLGSQVAPETCAPFLGDGADVIPYHYVLEGRLRVRTGDEPVLDLGPGEIVLLPRNDWHLLGGDLRLPPVSGDDVVKAADGHGLATIRLGGGGPSTRIVCGFLGGENLAMNPVVSALPAVLHLEAGEGSGAEWIRSTFNFAAEEVAAGRMGSGTVLAKLSELLFVEAVRRHAATLPQAQGGWLAGLRDPYLSRALALLHSRLDHRWSVDELGRTVGLSRSALAERFNTVIGVPPMQYLTGWRMQAAAHALRNSNRSVAQVALRVGYDSEAAFSRAFKRAMGASPAAWRRQDSQGADGGAA